MVNVATGHFVIGQNRLASLLAVPLVKWTNNIPPTSPAHEDVPYAFKAWALYEASKQYTTLFRSVFRHRERGLLDVEKRMDE